MIYGVALMLGAVAGPLLIRVPEEAGVPLHRRAGFKLALSVTGLSFALNYSQTPFFFDVLHMHFGFGTTSTSSTTRCSSISCRSPTSRPTACSAASRFARCGASPKDVAGCSRAAAYSWRPWRLRFSRRC